MLPEGMSECNLERERVREREAGVLAGERETAWWMLPVPPQLVDRAGKRRPRRSWAWAWVFSFYTFGRLVPRGGVVIVQRERASSFCVPSGVVEEEETER